MVYDVGRAYTWSYTILDPVTRLATSGLPASATLAVIQPDQTAFPGSPFTLTPANPLTKTITPTQAGLHQFTVTAIGGTLPVTPLVSVDFENFRNYTSAISLAAAKERLGITVTVNDEKLRLLMSAATREVERVVGNIVIRTYVNEFIPGTYRDTLRVSHGPIFMPPSNTASNGSVTALSSAYPQGPSWPAGGNTNELLVAASPGTIRHVGLIPFWYGPWLATYQGGRMNPEEDIIEGVQEVLFDMWQQMRGLTADLSAQQMTELVSPPYYRMPPRALASLKGYEMPGFG